MANPIDDSAPYVLRIRAETDYTDEGIPSNAFGVPGGSLVSDVGLTDVVTVLLARGIEVAPADDLGLEDSVTVARGLSVTVTDDLGLTDPVRLSADTSFVNDLGIEDSVNVVKAIYVAVTDDLGLEDSVTDVSAVGSVLQDDLGLEDFVVAARSIHVTVLDDLGLEDSVEAEVVEALTISLPGIDGATGLPGIGSISLWSPELGELTIDLPGIDGASEPPGILSIVNVFVPAPDPEPPEPTIPTPLPPGSTYLSGTTTPAHPGPDSYGGADPAIPPTTIRARLFAPNGSAIAWLDNASNVQWQDPLNDVGFGSLDLPLDDALVASVTVGCEIGCYLYGILAYRFVVEGTPSRNPTAEGEEAAQALQVAGRGRVNLLDRAQVHSAKGVDDPLVPQHRLFSFASIDFPNASTWPQARSGVRADEIHPDRYAIIEYTTVSIFEDDATEFIIVPAPIGWQIPQSYWIWGQDDTTPEGFNYFRKTFTLGGPTNLRFAVTADNFYVLYLDGQPILGDNVNTQCWSEHKQLTVTLPAGTYTLGAVVENAPWPPEFANPAGFLFAAFPVDGEGETVPREDPEPQFFARSDGSWRALAYPTKGPGWTPGQIVRKLIDEAQARGALGGFSVDFGPWSDSFGSTWNGALDAGAHLPGFSVPVGSSVLDALNQLVDGGWVDYRVKPGGKILQLVNPDTAPISTAEFVKTGNVTTQNIVTQDFDTQSVPVNDLLVKWPYGYFRVEDAASKALYGTYEGSVSIDSEVKDEARRMARVLLNDIAHPRSAVVLEIDPVDDDDKPYLAFGPGDRVSAPNETGSPTLYRVLAITVSQDEMGEPVIVLELDTRLNRRVAERDKLFQTLGSGVVGNTKVRNSMATTGGVAK